MDFKQLSWLRIICYELWGLNEQEIAALSNKELEFKLKRARDRFWQTGVHYVVDSINDALPLLDKINQRLYRGERP